MGKKLSLILILVSAHFFAQEESVIRAGLVKSSMTISPSKSLSTSNSYFYFHGFLEAYLNDKVSVSGEGYWYQGMISGGRSDFKYNHALFFGLSRHWAKNNFDFYIGIQPGITLTKINPPFDALPDTKTAVNPTFSSLMGVNYFAGKYVHFFIQTRLVLAEHQTNFSKNISDLRLSAGLGFNINTIKAK